MIFESSIVNVIVGVAIVAAVVIIGNALYTRKKKDIDASKKECDKASCVSTKTTESCCEAPKEVHQCSTGATYEKESCYKPSCAEKKVEKKTTVKKSTTKKSAPKKSSTTIKKAAPKKSTTTKSKTASKTTTKKK